MKKCIFPSKLFISGTDTGVGKTVVSAMLTKGLNASYWKPIQSGLDNETDSQFVQRVTGVKEKFIIQEQYRLTKPLSPHASAAIDGVRISLSDFSVPEIDTDHLIVEGAGGLLVPINDQDMIIDLISSLGMPVLLVVRSQLGTLNHTFLSLEALHNRNIPIFGIIMNGRVNKSNRTAIEKYGKVDILAELEPLPELTSESLDSEFRALFR